MRDTATAALRAEARTVLIAAGITPVDLDADRAFAEAGVRSRPIEGHARGGSSTWQSLARAGALESDYLFGEIALLARLTGTEAPHNTAIQRRLARAAATGTPPGTLDDTDLAATLDL